MISDRLTDEQLAEILSGAVDGMEPTTQELAMATELQELRKQNELQRGKLLKTHITLLNQQKQLQRYRNTDSAEPVAMRWRWKDAELLNTGEWWYHDARYFAELSVDDSRECELMYSSPQSISGYPESLPCPVLLEPGMRFGKGVRTQTMLKALQRRAEYYAELDAMTPEERAGHDAKIAAFKTMLPQPLTDALRDVIAERQRQISVKGWTPEHDDTYIGCELAAAAISYIEPVEAENYWPADWHDGSFRPSDYRRNLVKATALLLAELERLDRISATSVLSEVSDGEARED
ncbi:hypothetical protein MKB28_001697 [Salmonella enterica]|nr:hypothetical protein [Salmonella enterica]